MAQAKDWLQIPVFMRAGNKWIPTKDLQKATDFVGVKVGGLGDDADALTVLVEKHMITVTAKLFSRAVAVVGSIGDEVQQMPEGIASFGGQGVYDAMIALRVEAGERKKRGRKSEDGEGGEKKAKRGMKKKKGAEGADGEEGEDVAGDSEEAAHANGHAAEEEDPSTVVESSL